jgi:beta-glucanase (GH16 family)
MKTKRILALAVAALSASVCLGAGVQAPAEAATKYKLLWSQEFNDKKVARPDARVWDYDLTDGYGWGNSEQEYYTNSGRNVRINGKGQLTITALRLSDTDPILDHCFACTYTSARLKTAGLLGFRYGRMVARMKLPTETGTWPAFWMLGNDLIKGGTWPEAGEIDIVETRGSAPNVVHGTVHGPGYSGGNGRGSTFYAPNPVSNGYHTYGIDWLPNKIVWTFDGHPYFTMTPADTGGNRYVYNQEFFLILNLAMGGEFPGDTDPAVKSSVMTVDWIRYYSINGQGRVFKH